MATTGSCLCRVASDFECLVVLGVDDGVLFDPADLVLLRLHLEKAAAVLKHFELLAVLHLGYAIGDRRHAVVQIHLPRRDVDHVVLFLVKAPASGSMSASKRQGHKEA